RQYRSAYQKNLHFLLHFIGKKIIDISGVRLLPVQKFRDAIPGCIGPVVFKSCVIKNFPADSDRKKLNQWYLLHPL
ncbi:hypothetical protein KNV96_05985, partial [Chryseobacterium indologenes]|uniref:hypothetical protein n=1 Tax=Chryseobacterium indologenes TaxID=253 RepID=UPI001C094C41